MKVEVTFQPVFNLPLTIEDARLLRELAQQHYDGTCMAAGGVGGFIHGWCMRLGGPWDEPTTVQAERDQMDITLKVLSLRGSGLLHGRRADIERAGELSRAVQRCLDRWPYIKPAATIIDTESRRYG